MKTAKSAGGAVPLATDFSTPARRAYIYAVKFSSTLQSSLILLHVVKALPEFDTWSPSARRLLHQLRTKALLELGRMARIAQDAGVSVEHRLIVGIPEDAILKTAEESGAAFIAMGTHGRTGWDRLQLGSNTEAMLRKAPCPVLTVHDATAADVPLNPRRVKLKRILVAMDFSASSGAAFRSAVRLARQFDARVVLVHAFDPAKGARSGRGHAGDSIRQRADRRLQQAVAAEQAERHVAERISESGNPVKVILDQAKRVTADLIVMGTNGRRHMHRLVMGSVAESVVRRGGCPVLVVKAGVRQAHDT